MSFPPLFRTLVAFFLLCATICAADQKPAVKEGWLEIHSPHFWIITDAGEKRGREVALRLEQMRTVFGDLLLRSKVTINTPLQVLALKSDKDYERISPLRGGVAITAPGFFLAGEDRNTIVLDLFAEEPWRAVAHPFAHMLLDANYPPTPPWFDEGLAEYFASIRVDDKTVSLGGDPELSSKYSEDLTGNVAEVRNPPKSLTELLNSSLWLKAEDLFTMKLATPPYQEGTHRTLFYAQSWIVVHYILAKNLLPQAGAYFELVQNRKLPVEQALQQAFGMSSEQFTNAVQEYFHSLTPLLVAQDKADRPNSEADLRNNGPQLSQARAPFGPNDVAMVVNKLSDDDGHAIVAEVMTRQPEHREQGLKELQALAAEPSDNQIAHRALGLAHIQKKEFKQASEELQQALDIASNDPWARYYMALLKVRMEQASGQPIQGGLANVQQNLRAMTDAYSDFAEAYRLLGLAELEGGGINAALDTMRLAMQLSPRNQTYVMNLADIYLAGKKWDEGQAVLERLKAGSDPHIAAVAKKKLDDLPFLKKYGITPDRAPDAQNPHTIEANSGISNPLPDEKDARPELKPRGPDKRPVHYLKGKIIGVDCSQAPVAIITMSSKGLTLRLRTSDYKTLVLLGADQFSCDWKNRVASANYRSKGKTEGDLVSLEVD
jgi:tetratricopeptide (TPR) repeat protein